MIQNASRVEVAQGQTRHNKAVLRIGLWQE